MKTVKVFQIGLGSFGRHGFEKFIEMQSHYEEVDVEICGVCDKDFERLESAEKFAEAHSINVETFTSTEKIYEAAEKTSSESSKILIYDAGPTELHSEHIYRSLQKGFFHLAEKPPSMTREEHLKEKKLMLDNDVRFTVDFIERESPVIKKTINLMKNEQIESIEIFRESSIGIQKMIQPVERAGVKGGAVLDKMCNEAYILDLIDGELEVDSVEKDFYMPFQPGSDSFMSVRGGKTTDLGELTASGMCKASISANDTDISIHGSWLGVSNHTKTVAEEIEGLIGYNPVSSDFSLTQEQGFLDEEALFIVIEGTRNIVGDMLNDRLFDLDSGEEIETPELIHDQLYRVLESSIRCAADLENNALTEEDIDKFMNTIFDISEEYDAETDEFEALQRSNKRVRERTLDNIFEAEASSEEV